MADLPKDIRAFIHRHLDSVEQLTVVGFLREHDDRSWTADELSSELRSSVTSIERRLSGLVRRRLVSAGATGYRYDPSERTDAAVARVLQLFRERPTAVIEAIFATGPHPLQSFSEAFKLGGDDDDC